MSLRRAASLEVGQGVVSSYVHGAVIDGAGKMGVLVALESTGKTDELSQLGRQLAMHVAATNPQALDPSGLDPAIVTREKDVLADKYRQQGKPENVIEKIVESGLKTYYKEVCLLEQAFIHDEKGKSVAQAVKEAEGKIGAPVKIAGFVRYALGEESKSRNPISQPRSRRPAARSNRCGQKSSGANAPEVVCAGQGSDKQWLSRSIVAS